MKDFTKQDANDRFAEKFGPFLVKAKAECEITEKVN